MKKLTSFLLLFALLLGMMTACHMDFDAKEVDWGEIKLGYLLPEPKSNLMAIVKNEEDELRVSIHHTTETDYLAYQDKCQNEYGFNGQISTRDGYFSAYHQESYYLTISYNNLLEEMEINLRHAPYYTEYTNQEDTTTESEPVLNETEGMPDDSGDSTEIPNDDKTELALDYADAETFESALNEGVKVEGKVVQFVVKEYHPDSAIGVNCWAGEHLNFVTVEELSVKSGDIIIGRVTKEPTTVLGCWKVPYEVLSISSESVNNESEDDIASESDKETTAAENIPTETPSSDDSDNGAGHANPVFYSTNDYETAQKGNSGVFSYKNQGGSYDVYWIIDFDEGYVYWFTEGNGESTCDKVEIVSGDLNSRITVTWHDGGDQWSWYLHFKYVNSPVTLIVVDHNGFEIEFTTTDLDDALTLRDTKRIINY